MSLESYYGGLGNVVLRGTRQEPSIFVRHPKQYSDEFDSTYLPHHIHPAFLCGGVEDKAALIGKYTNFAATVADNLCSLPNKHPVLPAAKTCVEVINWAKEFGQNVTEMTIADHGLLVLTAHRHNYISHGNNLSDYNGALACSDYRAGTGWTKSQSVSVGDVRIFGGYEYTCIYPHTTSTSLYPDDTPGYWLKGRRVGGVPTGYHSSYTYTGSGPLSWYFLDDIANEADLNGNAQFWYGGFRLYKGQIQVISDAADPNVDQSDTSTAWKAIKPLSEPGEDGNNYALVDPVTYASETVHYVWSNSKITLVARELTSGELSSTERQTAFKDIVNGLTTTPSILYELGLAPIPGTAVDGIVSIITDSSNYYRACTYGGGNHSRCGIGSMRISMSPTSTRNWVVSRSRARELA